MATSVLTTKKAGDLSYEDLLQLMEAKKGAVVPELLRRLKEIDDEREGIVQQLRGFGESVKALTVSVDVTDEKKEAYRSALQPGVWTKLGHVRETANFSNATEQEVRRVLIQDGEIETNGKERASLRVRLPQQSAAK